MKKKFISLLTSVVVAASMMFAGTTAVFADVEEPAVEESTPAVEEVTAEEQAEAGEIVEEETATEPAANEALEGDTEMTLMDIPAGTNAKVEVTVQKGLEFYVEHKLLDVDSTLSDQYGYEDAVDASKVSALDALIAAHIDAYGKDKTTINSKLTMSYGNPSIMMGQGSAYEYTGFAINEAYPKGANGNGYNVNQAAVNNNDRVDFFWYEDSYWCDYVSAFYDESGNKVFNKTVKPNTEFTLQLKGFMYMNGYSNYTIEPIDSAAICNVIDADGMRMADPMLTSDGNMIDTDDNGQVKLSLEEGTYYLTAMDDGFDSRIVMPWCKIVVKNEEPQPAPATPVFKSATLDKTAYTYTGKAIAPEVTVTNDEGATLKAGTDYTVAYKNNKTVGTATAVVTGKGDYTFTKNLTFKINPVGTKLVKVKKAGKAKMKVTWKKQTTKTTPFTGYQVRYSKKSSMEGAKYKSVSKKAVKSKKIKTGKGKFYVQVRTYKVVNGTKYYSNWSAKKTVKVK